MPRPKDRIEPRDILNLSETQRKVLLVMEKRNCYLVHNEGENYECWLESEKGAKKKIRKDTANKLFNLGAILYCNETTLRKTKNKRIYYNKLSPKYLSTLDYLRKTNSIKW